MSIKKKLMGILFIFSMISLSSLAEEINLMGDIESLNKEYNTLVQQEQARFREESNKADMAKKKLEELFLVKKRIEYMLEDSKEVRKKKFFKDDYDKLVKKYKKYLVEVNEEIEANQTFVSEFEVIKELRGE